ncbi:MAG: right-handed parallel beta-helix repeat-containing protein [Clostridia bacterium]|nr:right-handed parallel beta-helix repeat-containing protein [Clostridia bacterium]
MKRLLSLALALLVVFSLCACTSGPAPAPSASTSEDMYMDFLAGNSKVYGDFANVTMYGSGYDGPQPFIDKEDGFDIAQLVNRVVVSADMPGAKSAVTMRYALIDCGSDGEPELALSTSIEDTYGSPFERQAIIKNIDGKLQLCHVTESYYRYYEELFNPGGVIVSGGSSSYLSSVYSKAAIDKDGVYRNIFSETDDYYLGSQFPEFCKIAEVAAQREDELDDNYLLKTVYFFGEDGAPLDPIFSAEPEDDETIKSIFAEAGEKLYTLEEISAVIKEKMDSCGVVDKMEEIVWTDLDPSAIPGVKDIAEYGINPVFVSTTDEFVSAIADDTTIVLAPGEYNVTEWVNANDVREFDYEENTWDAGVFKGGYFDEPEFVINNLSGLTIVSQDKNKPATIVCEPRHSNVIAFRNCNSIILKDIIAGHTQGGSCSGDVIAVIDSYAVDMYNCDLYGCGAYGIYADNASNVVLTDCVIHDCSYGCVEAYDSYLNFYGCVFRDCKEYTMFDIMNTDAYFENCSFKNLQGEMLYMTTSSYVNFKGCTFDANALNGLNWYSGEGRIQLDN